MDPKTIFGISLIVLILVIEIKSSKKKYKKDAPLRSYLNFKTKTPLYDGIWGFASAFIFIPYLDRVDSQNTILYYSTIIATLIIIYITSKISQYMIHQRFYNKLPMFY